MENTPLLATIESIAPDLTGQADVRGKNYSFRYAKPNDEISFRFHGRGKRKWIELIEHKINSDHSSVRCKYFTKCGGCSGQHIPYSEQFALQTSELKNLYLEHWDLEANLVPAKEIYRYRNRMDFSVFPHACGLREAGNFRKVIDIDSCEIQSEWADNEWKIIREYIQKTPELPLDRRSLSGCLKYVTLRYGINSSETMSIFTLDQDFRNSTIEKNLESWLIDNSTADHIIFCYNLRKSEVSATGSYRVIKGESFYREKLRNKTFQVPFDSFFQPNPVQFEPIIDAIDHWIIESKASNLLDLFCGGGFFSLLFGEHFSKIGGWEVNDHSVQIARELVSNKFPMNQIHFDTMDLFQKKSLAKFQQSFVDLGWKAEDSFLILDPPRNGAGSTVLDWIADSGIQKIAYVSCNPIRQWEELMTSLGKNYSPKSILITDPYPHTPHLESVLLLEKKAPIGRF
ncbi:class I SAM-dependent RNA methyltransferase [Leptospira sp. GIMC2001]|uniref:class I SAM-dependent RNA methyltransferase n=1 Tax=Leptospira sp. GIMC2001 TaxID=1513297 RepID=UPI00234BDB37|nr:RNA methyltransferase [Leptospira sp. GIMC2001]WCL48831.1 RNA methyltransferase [Leptospira sp. GIMC2001]